LTVSVGDTGSGRCATCGDEHEPKRLEILELLRAEQGGLFIPAPVTAEIDHLLGHRFGPPARRPSSKTSEPDVTKALDCSVLTTKL
jgi:hypothetical protein